MCRQPIGRVDIIGGSEIEFKLEIAYRVLGVALMLVNRIRKTLRRSKLLNLFFLKLFILFFLMTSIPVLFVGYLSIANSSTHIIENVSKSNLSMLRSKKLTIDQRLESVDKMILQSITSREVWEILRSDTLNAGSHLTMKSIVDSFISITTSNPLIDSITFFDTRHDFVLMSYDTTGTKKTKEEFPDQELLRVDFPGNSKLLLSSVAGEDQRPNGLIRYIRKINTFSDENLGYLVYNLKPGILFEDLDSKVSQNMELAVMGNDTSAFFTSGKLSANMDAQFAEKLARQEAETAVVDFSGKKYFISKVPSDLYEWQYVYIQDYYEMIQAAELLKKVVLTSLWSVLFVALVVIYMLSSYLYRPLSRLLERISSVSKHANARGNNEFKVIDHAFHFLQESNSKLTSSFNVTLPYFHRHSIYDLLTSDKFDQTEFQNVVDFLGIQMEFEANYIVMIDVEHTPVSADWQEQFETFIQSHEQGIVFISSKESDYRSVFIMNTDLSKERLTDAVSHVADEFARQGLHLIVSIGDSFLQFSGLPANYQLLLKSHEHKLFFGAQHTASDPGDRSAYVMEKHLNTDALQIKLINYINSLNKEKAVETLIELTNDHLKDLPDANDYIRYVYFHLCTGIVNHLQMRGIDIKRLAMPPYSMYFQLQNAENLAGLQTFVIGLIDDSIAVITEQRNKSSSDIVDKVVKFVELNYTKDLSLETISDTVRLNPRYLSTLFKAEKGMTIFDYITSLRMTRACELLVGTNKQIAEISTDIGFNNVQSFIRTFKQYYKSTPLSYRKSNVL